MIAFQGDNPCRVMVALQRNAIDVIQSQDTVQS